MCYSQPVSFILAAVGWYGVFCLDKKRRIEQRNIFVFYSIMETLQFIQYFYVDQCGQWENYLLTIVAHFLVIAQPAMWNLYRLNRETNPLNRSIFAFAFEASIVWAIFYTYRLLPIFSTSFWTMAQEMRLRDKEVMVGSAICTMSGGIHIKWLLPYRHFSGLEPNFFTYALLWFLPSIYERKYPFKKLFYWIFQLTLTYIISSEIHEIAATWCVVSIPIITFLFFFDE